MSRVRTPSPAPNPLGPLSAGRCLSARGRRIQRHRAIGVPPDDEAAPVVDHQHGGFVGRAGRRAIAERALSLDHPRRGIGAERQSRSVAVRIVGGDRLEGATSRMLVTRKGRSARPSAAASLATDAPTVCCTWSTDIRWATPGGMSTAGGSPGTYPHAATMTAAKGSAASRQRTERQGLGVTVGSSTSRVVDRQRSRTNSSSGRRPVRGPVRGLRASSVGCPIETIVRTNAGAVRPSSSLTAA